MFYLLSVFTNANAIAHKHTHTHIHTRRIHHKQNTSTARLHASDAGDGWGVTHVTLDMWVLKGRHMLSTAKKGISLIVYATRRICVMAERMSKCTS